MIVDNQKPQLWPGEDCRSTCRWFFSRGDRIHYGGPSQRGRSMVGGLCSFRTDEHPASIVVAPLHPAITTSPKPIVKFARAIIETR